MPISDKQRKQIYHQIAIRFNKEKDKDVIDWLLSQDNMKQSVCELVRNQIAFEEENAIYSDDEE